MTLEEALAKVKELEGQIAALKQKADRLDNAESLIGRQGVELGDLRKSKTELDAMVKALSDEKTALEKKLSESGGGKPTGTPQDEEKELEKLESGLTKEQETILDEAFQRAPEDMRRRIASDPKVKLSFIREAVTRVPSVPGTWRKTTQREEGSPRLEDEIKDLFARHRPMRNTPAAGRAGAVREAAGGGEGEAGNRPVLNPNDVTGSLRRARERRKAKE